MFIYNCFICLSVGYSFRVNTLIRQIQHQTTANDAVQWQFRALESSWSYSALHSVTTTKSDDPVEFFDEPLIWSLPNYRKPLHWVQKVSHLEDTLQFYQLNFNFKVYRHEEFSSGCEATCNGPYGGAWSKTMIGPEGGEGNNFCLELVFNYGVNRYERGNDLRSIGLSRSAFIGNPSLIGIDSEGRQFVETPDGHWLNLILEVEDSGSPLSIFNPSKIQNDAIKRISLHVSNLTSSTKFYENILGSRVELSSDGNSASCYWDSAGTCFSSESGEEGSFGSDPLSMSTARVTVCSTCVELIQLSKDVNINFEASQGRMAIETEDGAIEKIAQRVLSSEVNGGGSGIIVHGPIALEPHGERVLILRDDDGHEFCFVDARGFKTCVNVSKKQVSQR